MKNVTSIFLFLITALGYSVLNIEYDAEGLNIKEDITKEHTIKTVTHSEKVYKKVILDSDYIVSGMYPDTEYYEKVLYFAAPKNEDPKLSVNVYNVENIKTSDLLPAKKITAGKDGIFSESREEPEARSDIVIDHVEIFYAGKFEGMNVYKLIIRPLRLDGERSYFAKNINIAIKFNIPFQNGIQSGKVNDYDFFGKLILNYDIAQNNRIYEHKEIVPCFLDRRTDWIKLGIHEEGIYKISAASLISRGIDISSVLSTRIRVYSSAGEDIDNDPTAESYHGAVEVAREVTDNNSNGYFDENDAVIFYAFGTNVRDLENFDYSYNKYSENSFYWIDLGIGSSEDGKRYAPFFTSSEEFTDKNTFVRHEFYERRNSLYYEGYNFSWYNRLIAPFSTTDIEIYLDSIDLSEPVNIKIKHSNTISNNSAKIKYSVNGIFDSEIESSQTVFSHPFSPDFFQENALNHINVKNITTDDIKYYNGYNIVYRGSVSGGSDDEYFYSEMEPAKKYRFNFSNSAGRALYDITDPYNVKKDIIEDETCIVSAQDSIGAYLLFSNNFKTPGSIEILDNTYTSSLHSQTAQADMVIISPDEFYEFFSKDEAGYINSHLDYDNGVNSVKVVNIKDINNEFGRGYQEPAATRNFVRYAYENWGSEYFLLAGDGNYYIKGESGVTEKNLIYTSDPKYKSYLGRGSDDFYANLYSNSAAQHVALGRFTVSNISELRNVVDKTIEFMKKEDIGLNRIKMLLVADDEHNPDNNDWGETQHISDTEDSIVTQIPECYIQDKVYLTEYPFEYSASTGLLLKSKAQEDIIRKLNSGVNLFLYVGHGAPMQLSHERAFTPAAFAKVNNPAKYFYMIGATCSFGVFNDPDSKFLAEQMLLSPNKGSIGLINSVAPVFSYSNMMLVTKIFSSAFSDPLNKLTIGKALMHGKLLYSSSNSAAYMLKGDPALVFFDDQEAVDSEDIVELTTLRPDSIRSTLEGYADEMNGLMNTVIIDSKVEKSYFNQVHWDDDDDPLVYDLPGKVILSAQSTINRGVSRAEFILPKDMSYGENKAKIIFYGYDDLKNEYTGSIGNVSIRGETETNLKDSIPPDIRILFDNPNYMEGDPIGQDPLIVSQISDENGINTSGSLGHKIIMEINSERIDITPYFTYETDTYKKGYAHYQIVGLAKGQHTVKVSAWDTFNNYNEQIMTFEVVDEDSKNKKWIGNLLNHPNPVKSKGTTFGFAVNNPIELSSYSVTVYTINGRKVKTLNSPLGQITQFQSVYWDGKDADGDIPANGVYLYVLRAKFNDGKTVSKKGKLIFSR